LSSAESWKPVWYDCWNQVFPWHRASFLSR
jgi:hypothetical protein